MKCWICGQIADSSEHKIKKSTLKKVYGDEFRYSQMLHIKDGNSTFIQGPDSKKIQYLKTICKDCNGTRTQEYDRSYDTFFDYVQKESLKIIEKRIIDFYDVYGEEFVINQLNLFKYLVKNFGCDLVYTGLEVPLDLKGLLQKEKFLTKLVISFAINEDKLLLQNPNEAGMGIGELTGWYPYKGHPIPEGYIWEIYFSFLHICFWYNRPINGPMGAPWIANNRYIYLGSFYPLSQEQRKVFKEKIANNSIHADPESLRL